VCRVSGELVSDGPSMMTSAQQPDIATSAVVAAADEQIVDEIKQADENRAQDDVTADDNGEDDASKQQDNADELPSEPMIDSSAQPGN